MWRERRGLSLRQLSERAGITFANIQRIETGAADPRLSTLERLARALEVTVHDLIPRTARRRGKR
jgi:transcriptional regulator with XRE-family HTH domain